MSIPLLDLQLREDPEQRGVLLSQLRDALFDVGFLYIANHGVPEQTISNLVKQAPALFGLPDASKSKLSKINSPHFLGYTGFAEEDTQGKKDLREQLDFATELPVVYQESGGNKEANGGRDFSQLFWRLRGPNLWPDESELPGFRKALQDYHDALANLSYEFVHLVEEAFGIPVGTFDAFFDTQSPAFVSATSAPSELNGSQKNTFLYPQHRLKLNKYPRTSAGDEAQGVGPHRDSSGWLTFLYQVGNEKGLEVLDKSGTWLPVHPIPRTFVVNFGNAFEAATEGAVRATVHRVRAATQNDRYSIPFFMGLPLDLKLSEIRSVIPKEVRALRRKEEGEFAEKGAALPNFLDSRWDCLGESVLRKWIRSHQHVALKWYGAEVLEYYTK